MLTWKVLHKNPLMNRKYKLTWFARFSLFMLFLSPFCYFGVTQYQTNPKIKSTVKKVIVEIENKTKEYVEYDETTSSEVDDIKEEIEELREEMEELEDQLAKKEELLESLESGA